MPVWVFSGYRPKAKRQQSRAEQSNRATVQQSKVQQYILTKYNNSNQPPQIHTPSPIDNHTTVFPQNSTHIPYLPNFSLFPPFPAPITTTIPPTRPSISLPHHPCHHPLTRHMTLHTYSTPAPRTPP
ncbi:Hypothetical protein J6897_05343 [Nakaseomyces glabratus]